MRTTQAVIARLESGGSMPSTRTLEKCAKATGTRLKISFEPEGLRALQTLLWLGLGLWSAGVLSPERPEPAGA